MPRLRITPPDDTNGSKWVQITLTLARDDLRDLEAWGIRARMPSRIEALRHLIRYGRACEQQREADAKASGRPYVHW